MNKYLLVLPILINILHGISIDIPIDNICYHFEQISGFDRIYIERPAVIFGKPGTPETPGCIFNYLVPAGQTISDIEIAEQVWRVVPGHFNIYPIQRETSLETLRVFSSPDPAVYTREGMIPDDPILGFTCGNMRGFQILQISICPFKYDPATGELCVLERLILDAQVKDKPIGITPHRTTSLSDNVFNDFLVSFVENKSAVWDPIYRPMRRVEDNPYDSLPTDLPSLLGPPVDLVIITDNTQSFVYEGFGQFKKKLGINTVVKTVSWIRQYYSGVDDAEKTRNFIKDAVDKWGTVFVLLGGDTPLIPTRFIWVDRTVIYSQLWLPIASDLYYADLDGDWNFDGDEKYGELADSIDFYPEVFVGRVPTKTAFEAQSYIDKVADYLFPVIRDIQTKALFFSSNLDNNWPGLPYAYELGACLPAHFTKSYIDETLNNLTLESLRDSIHAGFNLVTGVGHGDVNNICVHFVWPRIFATNYYLDSLTNSHRCGLMVVVTCYTNPFQSDCFGEHWVVNPNGGGIGYIGPSSSSEGSIHKEYMKILFRKLPSGTISQALALAKANYINCAQINNWHRVHQFSISLLGDPTISLWQTEPRYFDSLVVQPGTLQVGVDTISLDAGLHNSRVLDIVLYKEGECFVRDSVSGGVIARGVRTESVGYLKYAVMAEGYITYIDSVLVVPVEPCVVFSSCQVIDTLGNADGVVNPGEYVFLDIGLQNTGGLVAESVVVVLVSGDSLVQVVGDSGYYGDIPVGGVVMNSTPLSFFVADSMVDGYSLDFELGLSYSGIVGLDSFQLIGLASCLGHFGQVSDYFGDTVSVLSYLVNTGHSVSDSLVGVVSGVSGGVVLDSVVGFPVLVSGGVVAGSDRFRIVVDSVGGVVSYDYRVYEGGDEVIDRTIVLGSVVSVCSLRVVGRRSSVVLEWLPVVGACGYRVYRALSWGGQYSLLSSYLGLVSYYEDNAVVAGNDYYYYVVAYDSSMNIGLPSDTVLGRVNPALAPGWPQPVYAGLYSSPNFGDIDPNYPGLEIVVCGEDGYVYAWHYDGTPLTGYDGRLFYAGPDKIWSSPAIGDVDNDGHFEIVFNVMRNNDNIYIIRYSPFYEQAIVLPGWPKSLDGGGLLASSVLADIDDDDDLEIFAVTLSPANIYAFHHNGRAVFSDSSGLLDSLSGIIRGAPAIGDLNNDGNLEIVCGGGSESTRLYVWDHNGNYFAPFPVQIEPDQEYSVVLGNITGDEDLEICFYTGTPSNKLNLVDSDGNIIWQNSHLANYIELCPAFGDINSDGEIEIILGYNDGLDFGVVVYDSSGDPLPGFPKRGHDAYPTIVADVNNDGLFDVLCGSTEWQIHAYDGSSQRLPGFPIKLGNRVNSSPAAFDIDLDGNLELMVGCYDLKFYVFDLEGISYDWPRFHYDPYNSGCYKSGYYTAAEEGMNMVLDPRYGIDIFPNPFSDMLNISYYPVHQEELVPIKIYDVMGRKIKNLTLPESNTLSPVLLKWYGDDDIGRAVPCGVYFVRIDDKEQCYIKKIIKIH